MPEQRYKGVKITTTRTPSGRWHASSGYGYADAATEAEAVAAIKPKIREGMKASDARYAAQSAAPRKTKRYRVKLATGDVFDVEAFSLREARDEANARLANRRSRGW